MSEDRCKIKVSGFSFPMLCPPNCKYFKILNDCEICSKCPVRLCSVALNPLRRMGTVHPNIYRKDWAEEWHKFFTGIIEEPNLEE